MRRYTTLFFDLDDTLLDFQKAESTAVREVFALHGLPNDDASAARYSEINRGYWQRFERGEIRREDIFVSRFRDFLQEKNLVGNAEQIAQDYFDRLAMQHDLVSGAEEVLTALGQAGYRRYLTTNGLLRTQQKRVRESGLSGLTDGLFISEELHCQKPDPCYFDAVIARIEEKDRRKILVIGDSLSSDIRGGILSGLDTCWFNPKHKESDISATYEIQRLADLKKLLL